MKPVSRSSNFIVQVHVTRPRHRLTISGTDTVAKRSTAESATWSGERTRGGEGGRRQSCGRGAARLSRGVPPLACSHDGAGGENGRGITESRTARRGGGHSALAHRGGGEKIRRLPGGGPAVARHPGRGVFRAARSERLRQDHAAADDRRVRDAGRGPHPARRQGHRAGPAAPAPGQHDVPELRAVSASHRARQHRLRPEARRHGAVRRSTPASPRWWRWSGSRGWRSASPISSPAARSSAWRWRARWRAARRLLLLDEPLAALDKKLRESTQFELMELQRRLGMTFVIVTHDQEEAMTVADRIGVMDAGRLEQVATPRELYEAPASRWVAEFVGDVNLFEGQIESREARPADDLDAGRRNRLRRGAAPAGRQIATSASRSAPRRSSCRAAVRCPTRSMRMRSTGWKAS